MMKLSLGSAGKKSICWNLNSTAVCAFVGVFTNKNYHSDNSPQRQTRFFTEVRELLLSKLFLLFPSSHKSQFRQFTTKVKEVFREVRE
jgi:hypothetical protein